MGWSVRAVLSLLTLLAGWLAPLPAAACSCSNEGDFLQQAARSPLIVRARVVRHEPARAQMVVQVLELWHGGLLDSGLVVGMGDGANCRPPLADFPVGSEWVLALDGPGAKSGQGHALSHCGEHAVRIVDGRALSTSHPGGWPLDELRERVSAPRYALRWRATLQAGERWQQRLPDGLDVVLEPRPWGWEIMVADPRRPEADNLARLTPPLHFQPNPREIEGWHFMKNPRRCKSRPYQAEAGPENPRQFIFSPAVADMREPPSTERIASYGRGRLQIESVRLGRPDRDGCPPIEQLRFSLTVEGGLAPGQSAP
ncbi:hypothetical protein [Tepidimonas fonticaldi]|uniref:hypothetical protein n=1 Tax=Tepidimonas fonticaldi TaxID=1101373 RepID=UPI0018D27728|nr:hypothetical protein [Tepidimonas fonticaldi]